MRGRLIPSERRLLFLRCLASIASSQWRFYSSVPTVIGDSDDNLRDSPWTASNHLFHKHPRLLSLEGCNTLHCLEPIFAYTIVSGLFRNSFVASRILHYSTTIPPGNPSLSFSIFNQMSRPNIFSWNAMIKALAASSACSLSLFVEMRRRGVSPDDYTLPFLLMSFTSIDDLDIGKFVIADTNNSVIRCLDLNGKVPILGTLELKRVQPPSPKRELPKRLRRRASVDEQIVKIDGGSSAEGSLELRLSVPEDYHFSKEALSKFDTETESADAIIFEPSSGIINTAGSASLQFIRSSPSPVTGKINCKDEQWLEDFILGGPVMPLKQAHPNEEMKEI